MMESSILKQAAKFLKERRESRYWKFVVSCLAVVVLFATISSMRYIGKALTANGGEEQTVSGADIAAGSFDALQGIVVGEMTYSEEALDFQQYIQDVAIERNPYGDSFVYADKWTIVEDGKVNEEDALRFQIRYELPESVLLSADGEIYRQISYQLPQCFQLVYDQGEVFNGPDQIGTYEIVQGRVLITFDDPIVAKNIDPTSPQHITGDIAFKSSVAQIESDTSKEIVIPFREDLEKKLTIENKKGNKADLTVKKTATKQETGKIAYAIVVNSEHGTGTDIVLTDVMTNASFVEGSLSVCDKTGEMILPTGNWERMELPALAAGGSYTLTYEAKLPDDLSQLPQVFTVKNTVNVTSFDQNGLLLQAEAICQVPYSKEDLKQGDLHVTKKETASTETGVTYEIVVSSERGTYAPISLVDVMKKLRLDGDTDNIQVLDQNGQKVENLLWHTSKKSDEEELRVELPRLDAGGSYTITYPATLYQELSNGTYDTHNTVTVTSKDSQGIELKDGATTDHVFEKNILKKSGADRDAQGNIKWTISINEGQGKDMSGWTLTDLLNDSPLTVADLVGGTIEVTVNGVSESLDLQQGTSMDRTQAGYFVTVSEDGVLSVTFVGSSNDGDTDAHTNFSKYTLRYTTDGSVNFGSRDTVNRAILTNGTQEITQEDRKESTQPYHPLAKSAKGVTVDEEGNATLKWEIAIDADKGDIPAGWKLVDELHTGSGLTWFTVAQLGDIRNQLQEQAAAVGMTDADWTFTVLSNDYWNSRIAWQTLQEPRSGVKYIGFEVVFHKKLSKGQKMTLSYTSTAKIQDLTKDYQYQNDAAINNEPVTAYNTYGPIVQKMDLSKANTDATSYDLLQTDGRLRWKIKVHFARIFADKESYEPVYVIEKLPKGVTVQSIVLDSSRSIYRDAYQNDMFYELQEDGSAKITFTAKKVEELANLARPVQFTVSATLDGYTPEHYADWSQGVVYDNQVVVQTDTDGELGTASQKQTVTYTETIKQIDKSELSHTPAGKYTYSIEVNPGALDLNVEGDTLTVEDTLENASMLFGLSAHVLPDELKVYEVVLGENGEQTQIELPSRQYQVVHDYQIIDWSGYEYNILRFTLPDQKHLRIEYSYWFTGNDSLYNSIYASSGFPFVKNTATLQGSTRVIDSSAVSNRVYTQNSNATATTDGFYFYKVEKGNVAVTLPGAQFELYQYDSGTKEYIRVTSLKGKAVDILETDQSGRFVLSGLEKNITYCLVESKAPDGYIKDDTPYYFYIQDNYKSREGLDESVTADVFNVANTHFFENEKNKTGITVRKQWVNDRGEDVTADTTGEVQFMLYRQMTRDDGSQTPEKDAVWQQAGVLSSQSDWQWTSGGELPLFVLDEKGNKIGTYLYYVEETTAGYAPQYENNEGITEGTITITNERKEVYYTLPNTGSIGNNVVYLTGLLFFVSGAVLLRYKKAKERRN